jgi:hypothetical protein
VIGEQLLDVAVRKGKAQVPPHCQQDDLRLKLPPFEQTANRRGQEGIRPAYHGLPVKLQHCRAKNVRTQIKDYRLRYFSEHSINDQEDNGADGGDENPAEVE